MARPTSTQDASVRHRGAISTISWFGLGNYSTDPLGGWGGGLEIVEMRLRRSRIVEMEEVARRRRIFFWKKNRYKRSDFNVKMPSEQCLAEGTLR